MEYSNLQKLGAHLHGHFKLKSGLHSDQYLQCAKILETYEGKQLINAEMWRIGDNFNLKEIDVVLGCAYGSIVLAKIAGWFIGKEHNPKCRAIWCERKSKVGTTWIHEENEEIKKWIQTDIRRPEASTVFCYRIAPGEFQLRRGFEIKKGENVLICEDVTTTGVSAIEAARLALTSGGNVVGIVGIADRRAEKTETLVVDIPKEGDQSSPDNMYAIDYHSMVQLNIQNWEADKCPLCKDGVPIDTPGSSAK